jgi:leader peptidase (prepilin peptidase) / N-methyltransferase
MNLILSTPLEIRLLVLLVVGACIGSAVNWAIYRFAWNPRAISPWTWPDPSAPPRRPLDRVPIVGWLGLRRESFLHGPGFWLRPMSIELFSAIGLALLYWWEVAAAGLLPTGIAIVLPPQTLPQLLPVLYLEFAAHTVLIALMLAASMIDVDETIIPDEITISGTLVGLLLAAAWPWSLLPVVVHGADGAATVSTLSLTSPNQWPDWLRGSPQTISLWIGLACWGLWCVALLPRSWYPRHGWFRAIALCCARVARHPSSYRILRMAVMGSLAIVLVWFRGDLNWTGLLSALVGMAAGGGLIWLVRIIGTAALQREAMGFGDVTLMAMLGAYLGWQPCLLIFFLAPLAGLVVGLLRLILFRDREIPYGPFLCLAALAIIVRWSSVWNWADGVFVLGWLVPLAMAGCLLLMAAMLLAWRLLLGLFQHKQ